MYFTVAVHIVGLRWCTTVGIVQNEFKRILRTYDTSRDPDDSDEDDAWGN